MSEPLRVFTKTTTLANVTSTLAIPLAAMALGLGAVKLSQQGVHHRPAMVLAVLILGIVAAVIPFRFGLPIIVLLSACNGLLSDFAGARALYWNEIFAAVIVGRSIVVKRPSRRELVVAAVITAVYGAYAITGTSLEASAWGAKVLFMSVAVGWALARLHVGEGEWKAVYYALATVAGASVILAAWQRSVGARGLAHLGLPYGERIRETAGNGELRAFAGFTTATPFSYVLAISICAWAGFALAGARQRRVALATIWLPFVAAYGILLAGDRTAVIGLLASAGVMALRLLAPSMNRHRMLALGAAAIATVSIATAALETHHFGGLESEGHARVALWKGYLDGFSARGAGPATAGSAYDKAGPKGWVRPLQAPHSWLLTYEGISVRSRDYALVQTRLRPRPQLRLSARMHSADAPARLTVTLGRDVRRLRRTLLDRTLDSARDELVAISIPGGARQAAKIWFTVRPAGAVRGDPSIEIRNLDIHGLPASRTPAERIWLRWFRQTPAALQSGGPGLVDNLYVSWVFQYGLLGLVLCGLWLAVLLWPTFRPIGAPPVNAAALLGVFLAVAAVAVNVWEEAPTDLLAALVFAHALAASPGRRPEEDRLPTLSRAQDAAAR